jgi:DNA-binding NarL/FixJ family response regulator
MVSDSTRVDALRATGWIVGVVAGLSGLLGPVLAGGPDPTSLVGVVSGSGACVLAAFILDRQPANIVDIRMPPTHTDEGLRAAADLRARHPGLGILLLSQWVHAGRALELFRTGGAGLGFMLKDRVTDMDDFVDAIRRVARGGSVVDPDVVAALLSAQSERNPVRQLTDREQQVLAVMAEGRTNNAIASRLHLGRKTVEGHVNAIFTKLGLEATTDDNRRVLAVLAWLGSRG